MPHVSSANIPYPEYSAIAELRRAHPELHAGRLRALVAFGELVRTGEATDIHLLEVVEGWQGPRHVSFTDSPELRLRGRLHLYFLTPGEFESPGREPLAGEDWSPLDLLRAVRPAYAILLEEPFDYAAATLARHDAVPLADGAVLSGVAGPISFLRRPENVAA